MKNIRTLVLALCALGLALPSAAAAAKPRYKVSINYERTYKEIADCTSTTGDEYRIKETIEGTTKYSETGFFPGATRRTGYRETKTTRESDDPYLPPGVFTTRKEINDVFSAAETDFEVGRKGRVIFRTADPYGDITQLDMGAPRVGKSVTRTIEDADAPERADDGRCNNSAEWSTRETVTIRRIR